MMSLAESTGVVHALTFSENGKYLVSGGSNGVEVWRAKDGKRAAWMMKTSVLSVAVSKDGKFIAAGSFYGDVSVWGVTNWKLVFAVNINGSVTFDVDFSPDSTKLVSADGKGNTDTIWDIAARKKVRTLIHDDSITFGTTAAKYSPQGDRIATATGDSVRIWDCEEGRLLVGTKVKTEPRCGLLWFNNHLLVKTKGSIKQINAFTGLTVSEWSVPLGYTGSCISLPRHAKFVAYATKNNITFWDTLEHKQVGLIMRTSNGQSIAFSPDGRLLAIVASNRVIIKNLFLIKDLDIHIEDAVLNAWKHNQLAKAEALLTAAIPTSKDAAHVLASRALIRAHLQQWDTALADADESIKIQSSVISYIAKFVVLVRMGKVLEGCRVCDIAFHLHSDHTPLLLLIKAIVLFMAGEHDDAISRVGNLIAAMRVDLMLYDVQAYMYFLLGNLHMESGNHERAIQLFKNAPVGLGNYPCSPPLIVSLVLRWKFDDLMLTIQQQLSEALLLVGRINEAGEFVLQTIDRGINMDGPFKTWVWGFMQRCLSTPGSAANDNISHLMLRLSRAWARLRLTAGSWEEALAAATNFMLPRFITYRVICERLEAMGRVTVAVACFRQMCKELEQEMGDAHNWTQEFELRCCAKLEDIADIAMKAREYDKAILHYTTALSLNSITPQDLLAKRSKACAGKGMWQDAFSDVNKAIMLYPSSPSSMSHLMTQLFAAWVRTRLIAGSWEEALAAATSFMVPKSIIYQVICERLEVKGRVTDAVACFHRMYSEPGQEMGDVYNWTRDFRLQCCAKLKDNADIAMNAREYDKAILHYTTALSLNSITSQDLLAKRSKAHAGKGMWQDALRDADKAIMLDPSFPFGYERKYAALHGMGRHHEATQAFETMVSKMSESSDPEIRERSHGYVRPEKARETICATIEHATRNSPPMLIDTISGRLCNKSQQASAFEKTPTFTELISTMTTLIDNARIEQQVGEYYRYATFSHKWEENEPLFEQVIRIVVFDLEASPTHEKLQMFCKIVREAGFNWAWSDTCCINKGDHFVLQEALVSMFKWYERSSMTIIYLLGVDCRALRGALTRSIWNTRAWTLQEYHASKVVRIYTQDWTPYLGLTAYNHKESPEVISEMEEATGILAQALMSLRPGLDDIREKLRLASMRQTTRVEDAAYSLLGIFSVSLPITYGEGDGALGRLLAQLLTNSGDASILAWTGISGSFNSCLPANIAVFSQLPTTHVPPGIPDVQISAGLRSLNLASVMKLYDRVKDLHVPSFSGRRMRLPCVTFKLGPVLISETGSERVFRAQTNALGVVKIRTEEDLSQFSSLTLIHPWIDFLLDRQSLESVTPRVTAEENTDDTSSVLGELPLFPGPSATRRSRASRLMSRMGLPFGGRSALDAGSLRPPSSLSPAERRADVLRFLARLQRPFGALLLTRTRSHAEEYKRVATESLITVQIQEITPAILERLTGDVRMLDVL